MAAHSQNYRQLTKTRANQLQVVKLNFTCSNGKPAVTPYCIKHYNVGKTVGNVTSTEPGASHLFIFDVLYQLMRLYIMQTYACIINVVTLTIFVEDERRNVVEGDWKYLCIIHIFLTSLHFCKETEGFISCHVML